MLVLHDDEVRVSMPMESVVLPPPHTQPRLYFSTAGRVLSCRYTSLSGPLQNFQPPTFPAAGVGSGSTPAQQMVLSQFVVAPAHRLSEEVERASRRTALIRTLLALIPGYARCTQPKRSQADNAQADNDSIEQRARVRFSRVPLGQLLVRPHDAQALVSVRCAADADADLPGGRARDSAALVLSHQELAPDHERHQEVRLPVAVERRANGTIDRVRAPPTTSTHASIRYLLTCSRACLRACSSGITSAMAQFYTHCSKA